MKSLQIPFAAACALSRVGASRESKLKSATGFSSSGPLPTLNTFRHSPSSLSSSLYTPLRFNILRPYISTTQRSASSSLHTLPHSSTQAFATLAAYPTLCAHNLGKRLDPFLFPKVDIQCSPSQCLQPPSVSAHVPPTEAPKVPVPAPPPARPPTPHLNPATLPL